MTEADKEELLVGGSGGGKRSGWMVVITWPSSSSIWTRIVSATARSPLDSLPSSNTQHPAHLSKSLSLSALL